jgi:hypothetical protein
MGRGMPRASPAGFAAAGTTPGCSERESSRAAAVVASWGRSQARWRRRARFDRAAVLLCWSGRAAHPAAEVQAEAELELVWRSGEIVRRSGEIGRRSDLGRHRRSERKAAVRAVPGLRVGAAPWVYRVAVWIM